MYEIKWSAEICSERSVRGMEEYAIAKTGLKILKAAGIGVHPMAGY
jgi:hypothetical protein